MDAPIDSISKYLNGELATQEMAALSSWRKASPENEKYFQQMSYIWTSSHDAIDQAQEKLEIDTEAALQRVHRKMDSAKVVVLPKRRNYIAIACSLSLLLGAAFLFKLFVQEPDKVQIMASTEVGQSVALPDGSKVWMEPSSQLSYQKNFSDGRSIQVFGEIYVDVVRDEARAFTVQTPHLQVEVLGTSFVINDTEDSEEPSVTVLTGKVSVTEVNANKRVIITKDMTAEYNTRSEALEISENGRDINHMYHATGELVFINQTLDQVFKQLEDVTEQKVLLKNNGLKDCLFKGRFKTDDMETILKNIQPIYNFNYMLENGTYVITNGYCNK